MKKEYIILVVLIAGLSAYLMFHKESQDNYTLPTIEKIDTADVTSIEIKRQDQITRFTKTGDAWTMTEKKYPVDKALIAVMLDTIKAFKLTALVSQKSDLKRYDLYPEKQIQVNVFKGKKSLFEFNVGKEAPTYNHTFVMIKDDPNVYHASGSFKADFNKEPGDYRDKVILQVKEQAVKKFTVTKNQKSKTLVLNETKDDAGKTHRAWNFTDDASEDILADSKKISSFLSSISFLKCDTYVEGKTPKNVERLTPSHALEIEADQTLTFKVYALPGKEQMYGTSSMNDYLFTLSEFDAKQILSGMDELLGEKSEDKQ